MIHAWLSLPCTLRVNANLLRADLSCMAIPAMHPSGECKPAPGRFVMHGNVSLLHGNAAK